MHLEYNLLNVVDLLGLEVQSINLDQSFANLHCCVKIVDLHLMPAIVVTGFSQQSLSSAAWRSCHLMALHE